MANHNVAIVATVAVAIVAVAVAVIRADTTPPGPTACRRILLAVRLQFQRRGMGRERADLRDASHCRLKTHTEPQTIGPKGKLRFPDRTISTSGTSR
jgi:hypothetical protein